MPPLARTNYIRHLNAFFRLVRQDERLRANHISLYLALFQIWNQHRFQNPFPVIRAEVLRLCRIGSKNTYIHCLRELQDFGFIVYRPAERKGAASQIVMLLLVFDNRGNTGAQLSLFGDTESSCTNSDPDPDPDRQNLTGSCPKIDTRVGSFLGPLYKQVNNDKNEWEKTPAPRKKIEGKIRETVMVGPAPTDAPRAPGLEAVMTFFRDAGYPDAEGQKFFHHYQANGWRQAGKTPIRDWRAAGRKWMLNIHPKTPENNGKRKQRPGTGPGRFQADTDKSYTDPL
ncbi:hypothetical protein ACQKLP_14735 [Chitinophaga sp. NPDC101104]|uniref:hypothetical protein n=1 Tax=Chitinophaga sp. NPDC101104 TaxID=3390561 RepID=UPI003CFEF505